MAGFVAGVLLLLGLFAYVFWPERNLARHTPKSRVEFLEERREVVFENLRDLNFEYRAGKYPAEDYAAQRALLENEAASILSELDLLKEVSAAH